MARRLFYEVTGERFSKDDYLGEASDEFYTENPLVNQAGEGIELSATARFLSSTVNPG